MSTHWTKRNIPELTGKIAIVTGGNSGLGFETAKGLTEKGATVILAVRNQQKGQEAKERLVSASSAVKVDVMALDLSDLASVRQFADAFLKNYNRLDLLINNAGVMMPPYSRTKDGFELQFGTNHLGHFALTGLLLECLLSTPQSRVVTVSSLAAIKGHIDFQNLDGTKGYQAFDFYRQSKHANLLFAAELQKKFQSHQADSMSMGCHPGLSDTNLLSRGSGKTPGKILQTLSSWIAQSAEMGALPTLYAATNPSILGGEYIGPEGRGHYKGYPAKEDTMKKLYDPEVSALLWQFSEELTGVTYKFT